MFNRRKDKLIQTSVENLKLYNRIKSQKSKYGQAGGSRKRINVSRVSEDCGGENKENESHNVEQIR